MWTDASITCSPNGFHKGRNDKPPYLGTKR